MKNWKNLSKRGLSLFLTLVMCMGMMNLTAFAADNSHVHNADGWVCTQAEPTKELTCEEHVHGESCYETTQGGLTCDAAEHTHGDGCYAVETEKSCAEAEHTHDGGCYDEEGALTCEAGEHTHGDGCYSEESTLTCGAEEHTHGDGCYAVETEKVCPEADHVHTDACYTVTEGEWTCVAPAPAKAAPAETESPAGVQAFLDAVDAIEVPEEDLLLEENAELAETFGDAVWYAYSLYGELTEEEQELEEVEISFLELQNMVMVLPDYAASMYALSSVSVRPDYDPNGCIEGVSKFGGSITKAVGKDGFYKRRAVHNFYCPSCGWFFGQSTGKEYANIQWEQSVDGVIDNVSFKGGTLEGYPCLEMDFTGVKAGTTLVTIQYDVNFHTRWNSSYAACPGCGRGTLVDQYDDNWYHYEDQFYVTVTSGETGGHTYWVYVPTNGAENGSAVVDITRPYTDSRFNYPLLAEIRNPNLKDKNGINGVYADVTTRLTGQFNGSGPNYEVEMTVTGLDKPTPAGEYISIYLSYTYYQYNSWYTSSLVSGSWEDEIRIVVYDPQTVPLKVGETITHQYKGDNSFGANFVFNQKPSSPNPSILTVQNADNTSYYKVKGVADSEGKELTVTSNFTRYEYKYSRVYGTNVNKTGGYVTNFAFTPDLTFVDTVKYTVSKTPATTTPVTIVKEFDGITEDQIPEDFALTYSITGCSTCGEKTRTLNKADATVTNSDGVTKLVWDVELPVAAHGTSTHTITFGETNANVEKYALTLSGKVVTLESLTVDVDAPEGAKPVITVTNTYKPDDDVYVLSYDGMGGVNCPDTQVAKLVADSHTFQVAGNGNVPTNGDYTFLGWAWTERADKADFVYDSKTNSYIPAETTLTKAEPSKTLYAVWQKSTTPPGPGPEDLKPTYSISVDKKITSSVDGLEDGGTVDYKVTVTNTSTSTEDKEATLYDLVIDDKMDAGLTMIDPENVTATLNGAAVTLEYLGKNTVTVDGEEKTQYSWKMAGEFKVGDIVTLTYSATVSNDGEEAITLNNIAHAKGYTTAAPASVLFKAVRRAAVMLLNEATEGESESGLEHDERGEYVEASSGTGTGVGGSGTSVVVNPTKYTVTFDSKGGTDVASQTVTKNKKATEPADPTREGWTFEGWYLDGEKYDFDTPVTKDITLVAKWSTSWATLETTITLSYNANGGEGAPAAETQTVKVGESATFTVSDTEPTREGYKFVSWMKGTAEEIAKGSQLTIDKDTELVAKWEKVEENPDPETFTVTIDPANGEPVRTESVKDGGEFTVPEAPTAPEGKEFDGWLGSDGKTYQPDDKVVITGNLTLTAQWKDKEGGETPENPETITVTWRPGYGANAAIKTETINKDSDYSGLYPANPTRSGYTFTGWGEPVIGDDGNITITARWSRNSTGGGGGTTTTTPDPVVDIPDENPPLVEEPDVDVDIPDEEPPLVDIPDVDVPLDDAPKTGDSSRTALWAGLCAASLAGVVILSRKKEDEEA